MTDPFIWFADFLAALPTYLLNGVLFTAYWLVDSAPALVSLAGAALIFYLVDRSIQSRAAFRPGRGGRELVAPDPQTSQWLTGIILSLWLVSQWGMGAPVPWIGAAMWLFGAVLVLIVHTQELTVLWNVKSGIAIYALAVIGSRLYLTYTAQLTPEQWSALIGSTESAAAVISSTRGNVTTIILWALWLVIPLGYFAMLLQQVFINPISLSTPLASAQELIERYRVRR
jgi:hypothetical protein